MRRLLPALLLGTSCSIYWPEAGPEAGRMPEEGSAVAGRFRSLADAYLAWYYASHPVQATFDGIHEHDSTLGRHSAADIAGRAEAVRRYLGQLSRIDRRALPDEDFYDALVLEGHLRASLLELDKVRSWERNPDHYRGIIAGGLYALSSLAFDTPERRIALAADRLLEVPAVLEDARGNLANPPRTFTEQAIDAFGGTHSFFGSGLTAAFDGVKDVALRERFDAALKAAQAAIQDFVKWMRQELLPRSNGSFALGPELFAAKLLHEEGIDTPVDELIAAGRGLLRSTRERMQSIAGSRPIRDLLRETSRGHPPADRLLDETRKMLGDLKTWASRTVDIPADAECKVQETPSFRRATSFASMEIPGPYEKVAKDAYYSITLPEPGWTEEKKAQHLSFFNPHSLRLISVHEAYPGHYTQFLAVQSCPSRVRKTFGAASFSEGWAHYCEELYVEDGDAAPELRLHQLSLALLRICRYLAGIAMHCKGMTVEQAAELFVNDGLQERAVAEREALRGTGDPTYLVYTLGKARILALRDEYRARTGRGLREFHNDLLRHGYPPIPIVRMILLGGRPR